VNENFRFSKLSSKHKKIYVIYELLIFLSIAFLTVSAIKITNPAIVESHDKISLTMGAVLGFTIMILAFFNRLKSLLKIKFVVFLVTFLLLFSLQMILTTLIWTIGLVLIPLMVDDLILIPMWRNLWYNTYE